MSSSSRPDIDELVKSYTAAVPRELNAAYLDLVAAVWSADVPTAAAEDTVPALILALDQAGDDRRGRLLVLLGVLAQTGGRETGGPVNAAVAAGVPGYLDLLRRVGPAHIDTAPVLYLLSQFPSRRDEILAGVAGVGLGVPDATRLARAMVLLDPTDRSPDLGRVWPSPSVWELDEGEKAFDRSWIAALTPEQIEVNWGYDVDTMLAYAGGKAIWSALNNKVVVEDAVLSVPADLWPTAPEPGASIHAAHAYALRCPSCHGPLTVVEGSGDCAACAVSYPLAGGILDLTGGISPAESAVDVENSANLLQKLAEMPSMGLYYESVLRPAFLRTAGSNWGDEVSIADEDAYLSSHVAPVEGPVLDLAAGTGRWTAVLADTVGHDRVIVVDTGLSMLAVMRRRLPKVPAVLASALDLPFDDGSLGAVTCWNALQAFPEQVGEAIAEVGRCLRPGGTFTAMTFVWEEDPIAEFFQRTHHFPSRPEGMLLFTREQIRGWLADAGMEVRDLSGPGSFAFFTAVKK
ncbi:Menaquinone/ubiquinone biosynthesis methylase [Alloactinosynnema sp. L-07]|uniref:class I SAM-dependent methyltransferase n=1 Tax=Alloactinosynnema sp. L-07 TaxID=1653480 RepID=UPI00065EFE1E|nr:class I SAM-dependent methyltransferase [Alloactinosynnema sp. L-07]CRK59448.1 Menaquinone/ubiquinone biosynthesis methylase [Alloactinosynnema sp. L-07]